MQAKSYISFAPGKQGNLFALLYAEAGADIHGWHIETKDHYFSAAFFMMEGFYAERGTRLYRSVQDDVYGPWVVDYPPTGEHIRCPVPEPVCHELERLQSGFVEEWLFFDDGQAPEEERNAYQQQGLPVHEVNIRARRLQRLDRRDAVWTYATSRVDLNVVNLLRKYWRLSEKIVVH